MSESRSAGAKLTTRRPRRGGARDVAVLAAVLLLAGAAALVSVWTGLCPDGLLPLAVFAAMGLIPTGLALLGVAGLLAVVRDRDGPTG